MTEETVSTVLSPALRTLINLGYITEEWARFAPEAFEYFYNVIGRALAGKTFYPEDKLIFRAFNECSPENLKVIIIGQD